MNIRSAATRLPRASIRPSTQLQKQLGRRGVAGTGTPTPKDDKQTKQNVPLIVGGGIAIAAFATYVIGKSSWKHGENIANDAKERPASDRYGTTAPGVPGTGVGSGSGETTQKNMGDARERAIRADSPKSAYKAEEEDAPKNVEGNVSSQDVAGSIKRGLKTDAPKTAYEAEEKGDSPAGNKGRGTGKSAL